jgi:hypothetical protein
VATQFPFLGGQRPRLGDDRVRDCDLADVVQRCCLAQVRFRLAGRILSVRGIAACRRGSPVTIDLVDSNRLRADERSSDRVASRLGSCRAASHGWQNTGIAAALVSVLARQRAEVFEAGQAGENTIHEISSLRS